MITNKKSSVDGKHLKVVHVVPAGVVFFGKGRMQI